MNISTKAPTPAAPESRLTAVPVIPGKSIFLWHTGKYALILTL